MVKWDWCEVTHPKCNVRLLYTLKFVIMYYLTFVHQQNHEKDSAYEDHDNAMTNTATKSEYNTITIRIPSNRNLTYSRPTVIMTDTFPYDVASSHFFIWPTANSTTLEHPKVVVCLKFKCAFFLSFIANFRRILLNENLLLNQENTVYLINQCVTYFTVI